MARKYRKFRRKARRPLLIPPKSSDPAKGGYIHFPSKGLSVLPSVYRTTLRANLYSDNAGDPQQVNLSLIADQLCNYRRIRCNSIHDPDPAYTGYKPVGYKFLSEYFTSFFVRKCTIIFRLRTTASAQTNQLALFGMPVTEYTPIPTTKTRIASLRGMRQRPRIQMYSNERFGSSFRSNAKMVVHWYPKSTWPVKDPMQDEYNWGQFKTPTSASGADPLTIGDYIVGVCRDKSVPLTEDALSINADVEIYYDVICVRQGDFQVPSNAAAEFMLPAQWTDGYLEDPDNDVPEDQTYSNPTGTMADAPFFVADT